MVSHTHPTIKMRLKAALLQKQPVPLGFGTASSKEGTMIAPIESEVRMFM